VPPIFQPEVGADAVHHAVRHDVGRELLVAWPTLKSVIGEKLVPGYVDRKLSRTGYADEETGTPADPTRPNNLWYPAPNDVGAHGRFDDRAKSVSVELWLSKRRRWIALAGGLFAGAMVAGVALRGGVRQRVGG
ncbi:MAG TPA: hypothetical protein VHV78_10755, partial [Gemmatimonadaceae bacterium]|nr:hypothetical protein [Gemmatimonadaceae bacterium]